MSNPQHELKGLRCLSKMQLDYYLKNTAIMEEQATQETKVLYAATGQEKTGRSGTQLLDISLPTNS